MTITQRAHALELLGARSMMRLRDFAAHGIGPETLVPKGIICLVSALQFHELTLQMPSSVWMAIERTAWRPRIDYPPIRFVRFTGSTLSEGI